MNRIAWDRVAVAGVLAGLVWTFLSIVLLGIAGREFMAAVVGGGRAPRPDVQLFLFGANLAAAVWAAWLYAALRAHYGRGIGTSAVAGVAWWIIVSMQSAKWLALSPVSPRDAILPALLTLPAIILSAMTAGWCYENFRWRRSDGTPDGGLP